MPRDEDVKTAKEICEILRISERALRQWTTHYGASELDELRLERPNQKKGSYAILEAL